MGARKTVILKNYYFTASVEQDWETNEHTAFSFGWMPLFVFGAKSLVFMLNAANFGESIEKML